MLHVEASYLPRLVAGLPSILHSHRCFPGVASRSVGAEVASGSRPEILWSPGGDRDDERIRRLAGKIGILCRDGEGLCVVGARGEASTAHAVRALATGSELGKSPVEFRARWQEEDEQARSLRFYCELRYTWTAFKEMWKPFNGKARVLPVTPHTGVHRLATALVTEQRVKGAAVLKLNYSNDSVLNIAAKALATMPHLAQNAALGSSLVCVVRWNIRGPESTFAYAHLFRRPQGRDGQEGAWSEELQE